MYETADTYGRARLRKAAFMAIAMCAFGVYTAVAAIATLIFPLFLPAFLAPAALLIFIFAPRGRAAPKSLVMPLIFTAAALMPFWPIYIHLALGSLPLLTPPRVIFYLLSAVWAYDMAVSPLRRGQFVLALKKRPWLAWAALGFFILNALSVPLAEGKSLAGQAFFRQAIILLLPFCVFVTYVRRWRDFRMILLVTALGATAAGAIAVIEFASQTLLASKLSPLIMGDANWLQITQSLKSRDGVFRAQATHTHPISLGEYLCFCAPLVFGFMLQARRWKRLLWAGALALVIGGLIATNSRGAMLAIAPGLGLVGAVLLLRTLRDPSREVLRPLVGLASLVVIGVSPGFLYVAHSMATGEAGTSAARSSQSRIDQIEKAWPKIVKRPVLGHGTGRSARVVGYFGRTLTLDNYYLSLAVDLGFPGPIVFIAIMIIAAQRSLYDARHGPPYMRWLLIGLAGAMAAFLLSRLVNSQTGNLNFFFPLIGAYIGASADVSGRLRARKDRRLESGYS